MATVTMELDELDLIKKNAKEIEQGLKNEIEALKNQNATLINSSKKVLVKKQTIFKNYLVPFEYFNKTNYSFYEVSVLRDAIRNNEPIWLMGKKFKYDEELKVFYSNSQEENSTESLEFIGFEEAKEMLKSNTIKELKEKLEKEQKSNESLRQELEDQKKCREKIIFDKMEGFKEEVNSAYKKEVEIKDNTIKELEEKLKKEQENFVQYKAKIEQDEQRMAKDDLIEKLRKEIGELKQKLADQQVKKSWFQKLF